MIVYMVVSGMYSGTTYRAAFATKELALQAIEDHAGSGDSYDWSEPHVEEYEVLEHRAVTAYRIGTWFAHGKSRTDGVPYETPPDQANSIAHRVVEIPEWELRRSVPATVYVESTTHPDDVEARGHSYSLTAEGTDKTRVIKAFGEKRAQMIAMPWMLMAPEEIEAALVEEVA